MNGDDAPPSTQSAAFGWFLLLLAANILYFAQGISGLALGNHDPGPQALPMVLGVLLLLGGVFELGKAWWHRRAQTPQTSSEPVSARLAISSSDRVVIFTVCALLAYLISMDWLGFSLSTILFGSSLLWRLGARWWISLTVSVAITLLVHLLFVTLFKVPLPESAWGIPF